MDVLMRLGASGPALGAAVVSTVCVYLLVVLLARLSGPRSLAKMSSFDFAMTVAIGSVLASAALASVPLLIGAAALVVLFGMQASVGVLRRRDVFRGALDNRPLLLMAAGRVLDDNLLRTRISRQELFAQLRLAGVHRLDEVRAVVLETTGDMSVLTQDRPFDEELMLGVRDAGMLP